MKRFVLFLVVLLCSCRKPALPSVEQSHVQKAKQTIAAFDRGAAYLLARQSEDGSWRSDVYGHFKHGDALTPLAIVALQRAPQSLEINAAIDRGVRWLQRFVVSKETEAIEGELHYPVYTASLTIIALSDPRQQQHLKARDAWVRFLLAHQFTEEYRWSERDWQYGGWGYLGTVPRKPAVSLPPAPVEANISATAYALTALRAAGLDHRDRVFERAVRFVLRCQNNDGGFIFAPDDPMRNKAGFTVGPDQKRYYRSYGSATADGLRCLQALEDLGVGAASDRANQWLLNRFTPATEFFHHGEFMPDREPMRDAAFFYYAATLSERISDSTLRDKLVEAVVARQRDDGSWKNELNTLREDEPIVATALAMLALRSRQE